MTQLEDKCARLDKDKVTLNDLLASRRREYEYLEDEMKMKIADLEDQIRRLANDKNRLMDRMNLPESERGLLQQQEKEIASLYQKLEEMSIRYADTEDENIVLKQEIKDLQLVIDEMHDQFREVKIHLESISRNIFHISFKIRILYFTYSVSRGTTSFERNKQRAYLFYSLISRDTNIFHSLVSKDMNIFHSLVSRDINIFHSSVSKGSNTQYLYVLISLF